MANARVESVNVGRGAAASWAGALRRTAIDKRAAAGAVWAGPLGLAGDEQCDTAHHGGTEQALYAYAREDLDWWTDRLERSLAGGTFGENVTTAGLDVSGAAIGETWRLGDAVVQVTAPRIPCVVFRNWMDEKGWIRAFRESRRPGAYLRVCEPGAIAAGDPAELLSRPDHSVTVAEALEAWYERDAAVIGRMLAVPGHSARWEGLAGEWLAAGPAKPERQAPARAAT